MNDRPELICGVCDKATDYLERFYDRHGIYSGRACSERIEEARANR